MIIALYVCILSVLQAPIVQSQTPDGSPEHSLMTSDFDWIQYLADSTSPIPTDSTQASPRGKVGNKNILSGGSESPKTITRRRFKLGEYARMKAKAATLPPDQSQALRRAYNDKNKARRARMKEKIGFTSKKDAHLSKLRNLEKEEKANSAQLKELKEYRERKLQIKRASLARQVQA